MKHSSYDAIDIYLHLRQYRLELFVRTTNKFDRSNRCTARRQVQQFLHQQFPHFETLKKKKKRQLLLFYAHYYLWKAIQWLQLLVRKIRSDVKFTKTTNQLKQRS